MRYSALSDPDGRRIRVGFLSTRKLNDLTVIRLFPNGLLPVQTGDDPPGPDGPPTMNQIARPALAATIRAGGQAVIVVSCHLKSKLLSFPALPNGQTRFNPFNENERARYAAYALYRRTSEAATLRSWLTDRMETSTPGEHFVLCGDLNDEPPAATTQILQGPPGSEIGTRGFDTPDKGDATRLWNLASLLPPKPAPPPPPGEPPLPPIPAHTRIYRGRGELIDHIFVSRGLLKPLPEAHTTYPQGVTMPSVTDEPSEIRNLPGSDHAAVIATFTI